MSWKRFSVSCLVTTVVACAAATVAVAQHASEGDFQRGFYLENHENDPAGAIAAYEKVLAHRDAPELLRAEAQVRLARCQEDLRTVDLAQLMPDNALLYVEIGRPGRHVSQLAKLIGLLRDPQTTQAQGASGGVQLEEGIYLPDDLSLSPALVAELEKVRGMAVAVTSVDPNGKPSGVAVVHPGDSDLVRGLVETSIQFLEPGEPIEGFKTYCVANEVWMAATHRLLIISSSRDQVAATVGRLNKTEVDSLATAPSFASLQDERKDSLAFLYVSGQSVIQTLQEQVPGRELQMARTVLDLDHLQNLSASLRTTDTNIELQVKLNLDEGHRNILHGLVQTAPITKQSLDYVPAGAAAVTVLGLNPAEPTGPSGQTAARTFSVMDLGRELFGNIVEVSTFVLPANSGPQHGPPIPEIGLVLAVRNPEQSEVLWSQLLTLPAMFGAPAVPAPRDITIDGHAAREYRFPDAPPIVLAKLQDRALVLGTPGAVAAAIAAGTSGKSIATDAVAGPSIETLTSHSSKAIYVHVGRALDVAVSVDPKVAREIGPVRPLVGDLTATLVTDEEPNALCLRAAITGLPDVPSIVKQMAHGRRSPTDRRKVAAAPSVPQ